MRRLALPAFACPALALPALAFVLLACGARSTLLPTGDTGEGGAPPATTATTGTTATTTITTTGVGGAGGAPACLPPPRDCDGEPLFEIFDVAASLGAPTVVQEIEALDTGDVIAAGYFGAIRFPDGYLTNPELLNVPPVVQSSFLQLRRGSGAELWATALGEVAYSDDAGDTWTPAPALAGIALLHRTPDGRLFGAGDALLGEAAGPLGPIDLQPVPALDGDTQGSDENNTVFGFAEADGVFIAAERFGRVARAPASGGPFTGDGELHLDSEPELISLGDGVLAMGYGGLVQIACSPEAEFVVIGQASPWPAVASSATQLARTPDGVLWAPALDGYQQSCDDGQTWRVVPLPEIAPSYDVSAGPNGDIWFAGPSRIARVIP